MRIALSLATRIAIIVTALAICGHGPSDARAIRNTGKYGAMFSWWDEALPPQTRDIPTIGWDARTPQWWNAIVGQALYARLGWIAAASWGQNTTADPAMLDPLLRAIDAHGGGLKVALFDDTTSEVLRKNMERHGTWTLTPRFDLADLNGTGEGGLRYFYDQQWKRYFATVPDRYRLKINGRPVVLMWHGGFEWYSSPSAFHALLDALRAAVRRDFGVDPFVIPEESWYRLDPSSRPDALYDWFDPARQNWTSTNFGGITIGHVIPGFNCPTCDPPPPVVPRESGQLLQAGLAAVAPRADLVLLEGLVNVDENAEFVETLTWGRTYLDIIRAFAAVAP